MGGCLFIDEAYALADSEGDSFSGEAVRTLLTEVENNRSDILVILAVRAAVQLQSATAAVSPSCHPRTAGGVNTESLSQPLCGTWSQGYEDKMITNHDSLLNTDPGLPRRFAKHLQLPTYSAEELCDICKLIAG